MFAIEVRAIFSAAHALRLPGGGTEPVHGHDFQVTVKIGAAELDSLETVADFHDIERALETILAPWRSRNLNDFEPFRTQRNPSAERIAEHIGESMVAALASPGDGNQRKIHVLEVRLTEAPNCQAIWSPPQPR